MTTTHSQLHHVPHVTIKTKRELCCCLPIWKLVRAKLSQLCEIPVGSEAPHQTPQIKLCAPQFKMSGFLEPLREVKQKQTRSVTKKYEEDDFFKPQIPIPLNMAAVRNPAAIRHTFQIRS